MRSFLVLSLSLGLCFLSFWAGQWMGEDHLFGVVDPDRSAISSGKKKLSQTALTAPRPPPYLLIPKLGIQAPIILNVDGANPTEYLSAIKKGVAHFAKSSYQNIDVDGSLPGKSGNIFLFGHSQISGQDMSNFQGVFNHLPELTEGDWIQIIYQNHFYYYQVKESKKIGPGDFSYLRSTSEESLTLMTCWPPGLPWQRWIVRAGRVNLPPSKML